MNVIQKSSVLVLIILLGVSACSQKPSSEEIAAQVKIALEQEKAKEAVQSAVPAPAPVAEVAPVAAEPVKKSVEHKAIVHKPATKESSAKAQPPVVELKPICANCGVVVAVNMVEVAGKGSGVGVVAGGVVGGLVGNQVGNGTGRDLATLAGVVGGAFAGNAIEKNAKKTKRYDIVVKMEDGSERTFSQAADPGLVNGEKVKIENDTVVRN